MLACRNILGTAKAVLTTVLPWQGINGQRSAAADSTLANTQVEEFARSIAAHQTQITACRGQEIRRSRSTKEEARWFVQELQSREIVGERTWRALWDCYTWFCDEAELVPLPGGMKSRFAQELAEICQRGQVRIREGGKLRRLTTYDVPDAQPACLRAAA